MKILEFFIQFLNWIKSLFEGSHDFISITLLGILVISIILIILLLLLPTRSAENNKQNRKEKKTNEQHVIPSMQQNFEPSFVTEGVKQVNNERLKNNVNIHFDNREELIVPEVFTNQNLFDINQKHRSIVPNDQNTENQKISFDVGDISEQNDETLPSFSRKGKDKHYPEASFNKNNNDQNTENQKISFDVGDISEQNDETFPSFSGKKEDEHYPEAPFNKNNNISDINKDRSKYDVQKEHNIDIFNKSNLSDANVKTELHNIKNEKVIQIDDFQSDFTQAVSSEDVILSDNKKNENFKKVKNSLSDILPSIQACDVDDDGDILHLLDLAKMYIELKDKGAAVELLSDVIKSNNDIYKKEALDLLKKID